METETLAIGAFFFFAIWSVLGYSVSAEYLLEAG